MEPRSSSSDEKCLLLAGRVMGHTFSNKSLNRPDGYNPYFHPLVWRRSITYTGPLGANHAMRESIWQLDLLGLFSKRPTDQFIDHRQKEKLCVFKKLRL